MVFDVGYDGALLSTSLVDVIVVQGDYVARLDERIVLIIVPAEENPFG